MEVPLSEQPVIYDTRQAAEYLGISLSTLKHHLYVAERLQPDGWVGGHLFFTQKTLDGFQESKPKPGWPVGRSRQEEYSYPASVAPNTVDRDLRVVNVSSVPQRSPFRYPGGKTWLVPEIRVWLSGVGMTPSVFVEPFAGGGIASLTAVFEGLCDRAVMCELDEDVAALWTLILRDARWLVDRILGFQMTASNVEQVVARRSVSIRDRGFAALVLNRVRRGGILASGASFMKEGENGRGLSSRWYPETLARRILEIHQRKDLFDFIHGDGFDVIERYSKVPDAAYFVDPPYTAGGKRAGRRLYAHNQMDHRRLYAVMQSVQGAFLMTYDDAPEVRDLAAECGFSVRSVPMKNTHHCTQHELLVTPGWYSWPAQASL